MCVESQKGGEAEAKVKTEFLRHVVSDFLEWNPPTDFTTLVAVVIPWMF